MPNRLAKEQSPYLRQHANNPVDWYPWGMEAFAKAKREDKPIFLSIGYSSCHWCHVMAKESFSDQTIASLLNDHFVAIKVDREERPDIDKHFQEVYRLLNRRPGGWPTSIFLTPEKKAFYAATYIPPEPRYGMVGFKELLETIAKRYAQNKEKIIQEAQQIDEALTKRAKSIQATKLELSILHRYASQAKAHFDEMFGGFGKAPKFPQTSLHETLLDCYRLTGEKELLNMSLFTLSEMARGGFRDVVEGGFCRYSTDDEWLLPHFEKMLYDNALLAKLYLRAFHLSGNDFYKTVAFETLDFLISRMSREGLFFSAIDAQSKGVEGGYYIYDYQEALQAFKEAQIPPTATKELLARLHITPEGNFGGKNIVRLEDITQTPKHPYYPQAIEALRTLRAKRPQPFIDQKIITSWNAMVIEALFMAGRIETRYLEQAEQSLKALSQLMFTHKRLYHSALIGHTPEIHAFLEDYAYLAQAYLEGYQSTLDELYLIQAQQLLNQAIERFYQKGRWLFSRGDFETEASKYDRSYPSSLALIIQTAQSIASLVDGVYEKFVFKSLEIHSYDLMRQPLQTPKLTQATLRYLLDDLTIKALPSALQPHIRQKDKLPYPYVLYRTDTQKGFMLCNKTACFAHEKHFEETVQAINRITKGRIK